MQNVVPMGLTLSSEGNLAVKIAYAGIALLGLAFWVACGAAVPTQESRAFQAVLALGKSATVPGTDVQVSFEQVVEDSRCPTGTTCIWAGDASVRVRFSAPNAASADYTLHTSPQFAQRVEHSGISVLLVSLTPHPAADVAPRRDEYRVTLSIEQK